MPIWIFKGGAAPVAQARLPRDIFKAFCTSFCHKLNAKRSQDLKVLQRFTKFLFQNYVKHFGQKKHG